MFNINLNYSLSEPYLLAPLQLNSNTYVTTVIITEFVCTLIFHAETVRQI